MFTGRVLTTQPTVPEGGDCFTTLLFVWLCADFRHKQVVANNFVNIVIGYSGFVRLV